MTLNPLLEPNWVRAIAPELILVVGGIFLALLEAMAPRLRGIFAPLTIITLIATAIAETSGVGGNGNRLPKESYPISFIKLI